MILLPCEGGALISWRTNGTGREAYKTMAAAGAHPIEYQGLLNAMQVKLLQVCRNDDKL